MRFVLAKQEISLLTTTAKPRFFYGYVIAVRYRIWLCSRWFFRLDFTAGGRVIWNGVTRRNLGYCPFLRYYWGSYWLGLGWLHF